MFRSKNINDVSSFPFPSTNSLATTVSPAASNAGYSLPQLPRLFRLALSINETEEGSRHLRERRYSHTWDMAYKDL